MKLNFLKLKQQTQERILRLFVDSYSTPSQTLYTCAHAGTHTRLHQ